MSSDTSPATPPNEVDANLLERRFLVYAGYAPDLDTSLEGFPRDDDFMDEIDFDFLEEQADWIDQRLLFSRGFLSCRAWFSQLVNAMEFVMTYEDTPCWWQIVDLHTLTIVAHSDEIKTLH